jgi:hypothetical protein
MDRFRLPLWLAAEPHFTAPVVVFQSDDWGNDCVRSSDQCPDLDSAQDAGSAWMHDALENPEDVSALAALLSQFRDHAGRPACFTLNFIVNRPDYEAIEDSGFRAYRSLPIDSPGALLTALDSRDSVFEPQLHGAEHVAPARWLRLLRQGSPDLLACFAARAMPPPALVARHPGLGAAYLPGPDEERELVPSPSERLREGLRTFRTIFGRPADGFVAPNHAWDAALARVLTTEGIRYLQACHVRYETCAAAEAGEWQVLSAGPQNGGGLWRQTRNVDFEPAVRPAGVESAIARACMLVGRGIPTVVNTHRINYVGAFGASRASRARDRLADLLAALLATREDVTFLGSNEFDTVLRGRHANIRPRPAAARRALVSDLLRAALGRQPGALRTSM